MLRSLAAAVVAAGFVLSAAPVHAKPDPIRGFTVAVRGEQIRATALVPGPAGRKAQLQQFADGRWVTVAQTRTKRTKATPRARWRVAIEDLRLPSAQSRAQAGPLAELARLRAQAGKSTSKPKKVKLPGPSFAVLPRVVSGFISGEARAENGLRQWYGDVRFEYSEPAGIDRLRYNLATANLTWKTEVTSPGCVTEGTGTFSAADLKAEGWVQEPARYKRERREYNFNVSRELPVTLKVTCGKNVTTFEDYFTLGLNTVDCPSSGAGSIASLYTGQPWTNRQPPYVFYNQVGLSRSGFCSTVLEDFGIFQKWDLTGSELFEWKDDFLSPTK